MKEVIYLVGQISVDSPETYEWRAGVREFFKEHPEFEIIDPCYNKFNQTVKSEYAGIDIDRKQVYKVKGIDLLVPKDMSFVLRSTIGFADLNIYDPNKMILGSFFELAWYSLYPDKSVIGIYDGDPEDALQCKHPFVQRAVDTWVRSHEEACEVALYYFGKYTG